MNGLTKLKSIICSPNSQLTIIEDNSFSFKKVEKLILPGSIERTKKVLYKKIKRNRSSPK